MEQRSSACERDSPPQKKGSVASEAHFRKREQIVRERCCHHRGKQKGRANPGPRAPAFRKTLRPGAASGLAYRISFAAVYK